MNKKQIMLDLKNLDDEYKLKVITPSRVIKLTLKALELYALGITSGEIITCQKNNT